MKEFSRCPSCGCSVDEMLRGHHSAADCSILKYGEREAAEARAEALKKAAERAVAWFVTPFSYGNEEAELRAAILADEPKEERGAEKLELFDDPVQPPVECKIVSGEHYPDTPTGDMGVEVPAWVFAAGLVRMGGKVTISFMRRAEVERRIEEAGR